MWIVNWAILAREQYLSVIEYWNTHNKSTSYSQKLLGEVERAERRLSQNPFFAQEYELKGKKIRKLIIFRNYSLIYRVVGDRVEIVSFWDNRRNPEHLDW